MSVEKTRGIVLNVLRYGDSSLITHVFTEKYGRKSFFFKGVRSKKSKAKANILTVLNIIELDFYNRESGELLIVKDFNRNKIFNDFPYNPVKSAQALFISEILSRTLVEETSSQELFNFLENFIEYFDLKRENYSNLHLAFLIKLTKYLGINPRYGQKGEKQYFDLIEGEFKPEIPIHKNYSEPVLSGYIFHLFDSGFEESSILSLNRESRNKILEILIRFYTIHNYKIENLKSKHVLNEVFSD